MVADQRSGGKLASIALMYCAERYWTIDARCQVAEASAVNRVPDCLGCLDFRSQCSSGDSSGGKQMHSASAVNLPLRVFQFAHPGFQVHLSALVVLAVARTQQPRRPGAATLAATAICLHVITSRCGTDHRQM